MFLLARNWWTLAVRGVVAIIAGALTFVWPGITVVALVYVFGLYAFLDGVVNLVGAWRHSHLHERWVASLLEGLIGLAVAAVTFTWPGITAVSLIFVIAVWAVLTGILEVAAAFRLRQHIAGEWLLLLVGIGSILFGVLLFAAPVTGALVIALWFGAYATMFGILLLVLAFRLRHWAKLSGSAAVPVA